MNMIDPTGCTNTERSSFLSSKYLKDFSPHLGKTNIKKRVLFSGRSTKVWASPPPTRAAGPESLED